MLGEVGLERLRDLLPLDQHVAQVERVPEHPVDPLPVDRRIGSVALLVLVPLLIHLPQRLACSGSWASSPCGKRWTSTGRLRNGPETSMSDSHSAWCLAMDMLAKYSPISLTYS